RPSRSTFIPYTTLFRSWYPLPADRNEGVWRDAWITNSGPVKVRFPQVQTSVSADLSTAALTVTAELSNPTASSVAGTLSGTITPDRKSTRLNSSHLVIS